MIWKINSKGFGIVEGLLIVLIIALIGGAGFYVYKSQQKTNQSLDNAQNSLEAARQAKQQQPKKQIPEGWVEFNKDNIKFYHPSSWKEVGPQQRGETFAFKDGTKSIEVFTSKPRLYYSSNAPYFCQLDGKKWNDYEVGSNPSEINRVAFSNSSCQRIENKSVEGNTVYSIDGGALGQFKYIVAVQLDKGFAVITDVRNQEGFGTDNIGTFEELKQAVNTAAAEFAKVN